VWCVCVPFLPGEGLERGAQAACTVSPAATIAAARDDNNDEHHPTMTASVRPAQSMVWQLLIALLVLWPAGALENLVGRVPAMGWSSWNLFRCDINEDMMKEVANAMVSSGLRDVGYRYINIDDCWMSSNRDPATGAIVPSSEKFPGGMKALGDFLHSKGLLLGIYSSAGDTTCEGLPGSYGYEDMDAK